MHSSLRFNYTYLWMGLVHPYSRICLQEPNVGSTRIPSEFDQGNKQT